MVPSMAEFFIIPVLGMGEFQAIHQGFILGVVLSNVTAQLMRVSSMRLVRPPHAATCSALARAIHVRRIVLKPRDQPPFVVSTRVPLLAPLASPSHLASPPTLTDEIRPAAERGSSDQKP